MSVSAITFVVPVNRRDLLEKNLLASPCFCEPSCHQVLVQENFTSASKAYNDGITNSLNDLIVFVHQDVFLPQTWISQLQCALDDLERHDPDWGVLGCSGMTRDGEQKGWVYSTGFGVLGEPFERPVPVRTLDEIVLVLKKSSGLRFDEDLPYFHLYGADICLRAAKMGMKSYAISAFCVHNTRQDIGFPPEFYECCKHIKRVWKGSLPIQTTCIRLTRFNFPLYRVRLRETYLRHIRPHTPAALRHLVRRLLLPSTEKSFRVANHPSDGGAER